MIIFYYLNCYAVLLLFFIMAEKEVEMGFKSYTRDPVKNVITNERLLEAYTYILLAYTVYI